MATTELNEPHSIQVPADARIETIDKSFFKRNVDDNLPIQYSAHVAIGGVTQREFGIIHTQYGFATLYCNAECQKFTLDFHEEMR